jgi:hypothetical protein
VKQTRSSESKQEKEYQKIVDIQSILRDAASVASAINVFVLAAGYYLLIRLYRKWFHETQRARIAGGRPQVVVAIDRSHLPDISLVVRNITEAPAKEISFAFSAPIESADGFVLSDLPFFRKGLPYLDAGEKIGCFWGSLPSLAPLLKEKGLEDGIKVTIRYKDLAEESYEAEWTINPLLFEGPRIEGYKGMNALVNAVENISRDDVERDGRQ